MALRFVHAKLHAGVLSTWKVRIVPCCQRSFFKVSGTGSSKEGKIKSVQFRLSQ